MVPAFVAGSITTTGHIDGTTRIAIIITIIGAITGISAITAAER